MLLEHVLASRRTAGRAGTSSTHGTTSEERDRARVAPQLGEHAGAPSPRSRAALTRPGLRPGAGTPRRGSRRPSGRAGSRASRARAGGRRAAARSASQRSASSITWLETSSVVPAGRELVEERPEVASQHRVEPDGRLVEHEQLRLAEERRRERDARPLAAGEPPDDPPALGCEADDLDHLVDAGSRGRADDAGEVAQVLDDREVGVDGRGLRDVADPPPERGRAGRLARAPSPSRRRPAARRRSPASASTCRTRSGRAGP